MSFLIMTFLPYIILIDTRGSGPEIYTLQIKFNLKYVDIILSPGCVIVNYVGHLTFD